MTPEAAAAVSGVPAETIRGLARDLAAAERGVVYGRMGLSTQGFGTLCQWAIQVLNILTGQLDHEGGSLFPEPAPTPSASAWSSPGAHDRWRSRVRDVPEFAGELPAAVMAEEIQTPGEGQIRAMVTIAGNPVLSTPDGSRLAEALDQLDFMVAVDIYLNETTRHADVILPPTTALERDQYDLVFHGFAVRNTARWTPAALEAPADARHDWQIFDALTERLGGRRVGVTPAQRRRAAAGRRRADDDGRAARAPQGVDLGPLRPTLPGRLQTPDQRIDLVPQLVPGDRGRGRPPGRLARRRPGRRAVLIGRRHQRDNNSWMHNTERLTRGKPRHHLLMHPDDLAARGLSDGAVVRVASRVGEVEVEVSAADDVMPGVVSLPHGYGHQVAGTRLRTAAGGRGLHQRPDRPRPARRQRQRRTERRPGQRHRSLTRLWSWADGHEPGVAAPARDSP